MQREQFTAQKDELNHAKEQIESSAGKIYSSVGGAIVEATKEAALRLFGNPALASPNYFLQL